ncbi:MAG: helix-turn-helix domain-containing protein [Planctomycetota bacterium]
MQKIARLPFDKPGALSRHDAATYIGISLRKLDELLNRKEIPMTRIDASVVVRVESLDKYLRKREEESSAENDSGES